jgi:hypothetical protein
VTSFLAFISSSGRKHEYLRAAAMEETRGAIQEEELYWYDFKVRSRRCRGSTKETNRKRAEKIAALSDSVEDWGLHRMQLKVVSSTL